MDSKPLMLTIPKLEDLIISLLIITALSIYDVKYLFLGSQLLAFTLTGVLFLKQRLLVEKKITDYFVWMTLFCLFCFFSTAWANKENTTALSCTISTIQTCLITLSMVEYSNSLYRMQWILKSFVIACFILTIRFFITVPVSSWGNQQRFSNDSFFGSNTIAMTLAYGAVILLMIMFTKLKENGYVKRWPYYIGVVAFMFVSVMLGTKKGILIFVIAISVVIICNSKNPLQLFGRCLLVLLFTYIGYCAIMNINILYNSIGYRVETMVLGLSGGKTDNSTSMRMLFITAAWKEFLKHPILGIGLDGFRYVNPYEFTYSHNNYVELLSELGIIGFLFYYSIWLKLTKNSLRNGINGVNVLALVTTIFITHMALVAYSDELTYIILSICLIMDRINEMKGGINSE